MDIERLRELLIYEPETGLFRWRANRMQMKAGDVAGAFNSKGYRYISALGTLCRANRLAWFYVHGKWPEGQIDHINGDRADDRIANLRDVTPNQNQHNRRLNKNSTSGLMGVSASRGKWRAQIWLNGKNYDLGRFATKEEAHRAYLEAKSRMHSNQSLSA